MQGRNQVAQWVTSFKVQASSDCSSFTDVDGGKFFTCNYRSLPALYVEVIPLSLLPSPHLPPSSPPHEPTAA